MEETTAVPVEEPTSLRARLERNALWVSLGALAVAGLVVAAGVQVAPETFYDRFWWEDIYGPLVVDARQCRTAATCPGLEGPEGVHVKDGYTVTSELTYGAVLAVMLYGIYVGLFRRFGIKADGWFVLGLTPWIMLGPLARALEDADVFCHPGTHCEPSPFAYVFISPVIYVHIALYVIAAMLLGVWLERRRHADARLLTGAVGAALGMGFVAFLLVRQELGWTFSALPPAWFVLLTCLGAAALFHWRAREGRASMNLTVFVLGLPFALGCVWLIGRWLAGGVWSDDAWSGQFHRPAGAFILAVAVLTAALVWALSRALVRWGVEARWARAAERVPARWDAGIGWGGLALVAASLVLAGSFRALNDVASAVPARAALVPAAAVLGFALLALFAFLQVGRGAAARPGALLLFGVGINLALVFGHVMDGVATWVALEDPLGFGIPQYSEKHPFSEFLLRYWNGFLFPFTKLVMVLVVAWLLDKEVRPDRPDEQNLAGLVKMAIFVLGFAPGLRDLLRLAMGV